MLLAIAELAQMSVAARTAVTDEAEVLVHRLGSVALEALAGLLLGGALIAVADLVRTSGFASRSWGRPRLSAPSACSYRSARRASPAVSGPDQIARSMEAPGLGESPR